MSEPPGPDVAVAHRLLLVRHSEIASHRGDVPLTDNGVEIARQVGRDLGKERPAFRVLTGGTLRTRQTAEAVAEGARSEGAEVEGPRVAFALRNPDIYVAGERVDMVSSATALAEQVPGMTEDQAASNLFFSGFFDHPDRIGWWLGLSEVPGDDATTLARRIDAFASSLADAGSRTGGLTVGVTHSPVLRACTLAHLANDPGEPPWVGGLEYAVRPDRSLRVSAFAIDRT
ncbi:phosphoglycerate mutase family protein [Geodermatophilus sp. SYSU D00691]